MGFQCAMRHVRAGGGVGNGAGCTLLSVVSRASVAEEERLQKKIVASFFPGRHK